MLVSNIFQAAEVALEPKPCSNDYLLDQEPEKADFAFLLDPQFPPCGKAEQRMMRYFPIAPPMRCVERRNFALDVKTSCMHCL
jgi:hypothetical protein